MRRPLTVRWWFRAGLVIVVLIGGYATAYLVLRTWDASSGAGVVFKYPKSMRYVATSEVGKFVATLLADPQGWAPMNAPVSTPGVEPLVEAPVEPPREAFDFGNVSRVYLTSGPCWEATACRVFYLAERVELWVRGFAVEPGETVVVDY